MKLPKWKYKKGNVGLQLNDIERKYLIEWMESAWKAEAMDIGIRPEAEAQAFLCERLLHRFYGYKIDRTKYARKHQRSECPGCGGEFVLIENHKCRGKRFEPDPEVLARI